MAQKNYAQMPTKKLNALLMDSKDENEIAAINEVLAKRGQIASNSNDNKSEELSPEEQAAIDAADSSSNTENASAPTAKKTTTRVKAEKLTNEEREALAIKLREEAVGHKCSVVPFNSAEWVDGVIVAIIEEKRTNKCLYAVKLDDGRRIVKAYGSPLIKISDEVVVIDTTRKGHAKKEKNELPIWTQEEINEALAQYVPNVGKQISYVETGALGAEIENAPTVVGRIVSLVPNKRTHSILYRIEIENEDGTKKFAHKNCTNNALAISEELDEDGKKINDAYVNRHDGSVRTAKTPEEALAIAEQRLKGFYESKARTEERIRVYEEKIAKLKELINEDSANKDNTQDTNSDNDSSESQNDDLM